MKRRISQGQAMRSIFGRDARDPDGAAARVALRNLVGGNGRQLRLLPADLAAFELFGGDAVVAEPGGRAFAELLALVADDDDGLTGKTPAQSWTSRWERRLAPGISRGSAAKSSSMRTSISVGAFAVPMRRDKFFR